MVHTGGLQGRLPGCGCHGTPVGCKPFRGTQLHYRKTPASSRVDVQTHCANSVSNVSNVKLPATHKEASQRALDQLRASSSIVNRYAMEKKSSIIAIGLTIHNTPVEIREKLAIPEAEWPRAIEELCAFPHIEEAAVLSTCNRMELYVVAVSWHRGVREIEEWMSHSSGLSLAELRPHMFLLRDRDATGHLLKVAGGLDSLVMGEGQILAQVKQVYKVGQNSTADIANMPAASEAVGGMRRFFDISVPRNIASDVNTLETSAHVYNVDDLKEVVSANKEARQQAAQEAAVLLKDEQLAFEAWRDSLATVPTIKALRGKADCW
ncbi:hypothetical protein WJX82_001572 [Trebouxia sp. C0006]